LRRFFRFYREKRHFSMPKDDAVTPLYSLERLPRKQKLRKITKILADSLRAGREPGYSYGADRPYIAGILGLLAADDGFAVEGRVLIARALAAAREESGDGLTRLLTLVGELLVRETGRQTADWDYSDGGQLDAGKRRVFPGMTAFLEDIRSPYNVGSIFRSAESFGAEALYISPLTADPMHPRASRSAMGTVAVLPWQRMTVEEIAAKSRAGTTVFLMESGGTPLRRFAFPEKGILIAGSEELGASPEAMALAAESGGRVTIPQYGAKGSLNVSVAFGIVMEAWAASLEGDSQAGF
jgi:TrmH family RNA methyltransferase